MEKKLKRSTVDRKFSGVCGGLAEYTGIDSTIIRLAWAGITLAACGTGIILYIAASIIIPE